MSFDGVFCDADVDTLMQIGNDKAAPLNNADGFKLIVKGIEQSKDNINFKKPELNIHNKKKENQDRQLDIPKNQVTIIKTRSLNL